MKSFTGRQYLAIDIANSFSKQNERSKWEDRLTWFDQNKHQLRSLVREAHDPALFFAGVLAWEAAERGEPSGYPISLDATASGMQILACLTGDRSTAMLCNVVPNENGDRMDAYTSLYIKLSERAGNKLTAARDEVKRAIMTSFYTSEAEPKRVFGEGELLEHFYQTLQDWCPGAWELNEAFMSFWNPEAESHDWVLPDNFHVKVKVVGQVMEPVFFDDGRYEVPVKVVGPQPTGRSLGANIVHSLDGLFVREMVRRCSYDPDRVIAAEMVLNDIEIVDNRTSDERKADMRKIRQLWKHFQQSGFLSARILDHIHNDNAYIVDAAVVNELIGSLPTKPFQILSVHDCFRCLPNYGNDLRQQYTLLLANLARSNMLSFLLSQLRGEEVQIQKLDPELWKDVMEAEYALS